MAMMICQKTPKSAFLFKVLTIISTLQHLSLVLRMGLGGYPHSRLVDLIAKVLTSFTLEPYFESREMIKISSNFLLGGFLGLLFIIFFSVVIVVCGLGSKSILKQESRTKISFETVYSTLLGVLLLILRAFGLFPLIQIFGSHFSCFVKNWVKISSRQCQGIKSDFWTLLVSISGLCFSISIAGLNQIFINKSYFKSSLPFSGFTSRLWKTEILLEAVLAMISVSIKESFLRTNVIILVSTIQIVLLWARVSGYYKTYYQQGVERFAIGLKSLELFWIVGLTSRSLIFSLINKEGKQKDEHLSLIYLAIGQLPMIYCIMSTHKKRSEDALVQNFVNIKSDQDLELLIYRVWSLIKNINHRSNKILLDGFIQLHRIKFPPLSDHLCNSNFSENDAIQRESSQSKGTNNHQSISLEEEKTLKDHYHGLLHHLITKGVQQFPKSNRLRLLLANFQYHQMGIFWSPVAQLRSIFVQNPSISHWFSAIQLQIMIEKELNLRENADKSATAVNIKHILEYDKVYHKFLGRVNYAAEKNLEFWTELSTKDPDSNKLLDLRSSLLVINKRVKKSFIKLIEYKVALSNIYQIFAGFVRLVTHDQDLNLDILERANQLRERKNQAKFKGTQQLSFGFDEGVKTNEENLTILQVSGNRENFGAVLSASNSIWALLGYKPNELEGSSLNRLLPKYFHERHDKFMENFLKSENQKVMNTTRLVFPMNQKGFIKACTLHLKIISSVNEGVIFIGVLSEAKNELFREMNHKLPTQNSWLEDPREKDPKKQIIHDLQFNLKTGAIINVSESCGSGFGLKASLFRKEYTKEISIDLIAPAILDLKNIGALWSSIGLECTIDTTGLERDHIYHMDNQGEEYDKEGKNELKRDFNSSGSQKNASDEGRGDLSMGYNMVDNTLKEGECGIDQSVSMELSIFEGPSVKHNLRRASIVAWFDREKSYGDDKIICLRFIEKRLDHNEEDLETMFGEVFDDEAQVSLNEDYEDRLRKKLGKSEDDDNSFDEIRIYKQSREDLAEKKTSLIFCMAYYFYFICVSVTMSYGVSYYFENLYFKEVKGHFSSLGAMINRGILISETRLLNRKIELVSSNWLPGEGHQNSETTLMRIKTDLKREYFDLQRFEERTTSGFKAMINYWPDLSSGFIYPFMYKMKDKTHIDLKASYRAGVYQYLSSLSTVMNAETNDLTRYYKNRDPQTQKNATLTVPRMHFYRADYNSIHSLRVGNYKMIDTFDGFMKRRIFTLRWLSMICTVVHFSWWWVALFTIFPIMFRIVNNNSDILSLFGLIDMEEVKALIKQIDTFKIVYLNNYLMVSTKRSKRARKQKQNFLEQIQGSLGDQDQGGTIKFNRTYQSKENLGQGIHLRRTKFEEESAVLDLSQNKSMTKLEPTNCELDELEYDPGNQNKIFLEEPKLNKNLSYRIVRTTKKKERQNPEKMNKKGKEKRLIKDEIEEPSHQWRMRISPLKRKNTHKNQTKSYKKVTKELSSQNKASLTSRRKKLEQGNDSMMMRVNKLIKKAHGRGRYIIYLIMVPIFASAFCIGVTVGLIKNNYATSLQTIKSNKIRIGEISLSVNTAFNLMYQGLAQAPEPLNNDEKELLNGYIQSGYESISAVASGDLRFPSIMSDFEKMFKSTFYNKVCIEMIKKHFGSTCKLDIGFKGLETISIFILESSRKKIIELETSNTIEETAKRILQSKEMIDLENLVELVNALFEVLFQEFEDNLSRVFSTFHLRKDIIIVFFVAFALTVIYLTFTLVVPGLRDEVKKCRGMLKLIPIEIFTSNSLVKKTLMKHKVSKLYSVKKN